RGEGPGGSGEAGPRERRHSAVDGISELPRGRFRRRGGVVETGRRARPRPARRPGARHRRRGAAAQVSDFQSTLWTVIRGADRGGGKLCGIEEIDLSSQETDEHFDREWVGHLVEVALARLAREHPDYHKALQGAVLEGASCADLAKSLGRTEGDIHNWLHRGK